MTGQAKSSGYAYVEKRAERYIDMEGGRNILITVTGTGAQGLQSPLLGISRV
jgi:hypothetical protein